MHIVYFAEKKLECFYDFLVDQTPEIETIKTIKDIEGTIEGKGKLTLGELLKMLGLGGVELEAGLSASGKLSFFKETVSRFTATQKLKALLIKLDNEGRLGRLHDHQVEQLPPENTPVIFAAKLKTDYSRRSESEIERTKAAVLSGAIGDYNLEIQASLTYMYSENVWRRWGHPRTLAGFGTLIGVGLDNRLVEVDPIVIGYASGLNGSTSGMNFH